MATCRVAPLEILLKGATGWRSHWKWWTIIRCPPCQVAIFAALGEPRGLVENPDALDELATGEEEPSVTTLQLIRDEPDIQIWERSSS